MLLACPMQVAWVQAGIECGAGSSMPCAWCCASGGLPPHFARCIDASSKVVFDDVALLVSVGSLSTEEVIRSFAK